MYNNLDDIRACFKNKKNIIIWGKGVQGKELAQILTKFDISFEFVDINMYEKYSESNIFNDAEKIKKDSVIIICVPINSIWLVRRNLVLHGYVENIDFFDYQGFEKFFMPILIYMFTGKIYIGQITQMSTYLCTLKCKNCMASIPYQKMRHRDLDEVKKDMDDLFREVDYVKIYGPNGGGEPFLYPNFANVIKYAIDNYETKFEKLLIVTNGTVNPSDDIIESLSLSDKIVVSISNYKGISLWENNHLQVVDKLMKNNIKIQEYKYDYWLDMGFKEQQVCGTEKQILHCTMECREYYKGKIFFCLHGHLAQIAYGLSDENSGIDIMKHTKDEIVAYNNGLIDKDNICKYCKGYYGVNNNKIAVAKQL